MIKASRYQSSSIETALYYVRLQTHAGIVLFNSAPNSSVISEFENSSFERSLTLEGASLTNIAIDELSLAAYHQSIAVDQWTLFPNALHVLVSTKDNNPDIHATSSKPRWLTAFVARFKAATAKRINLLRNQPGAPVWQRSYQEQLIQDDITLSRLKQQISSAKDIVAAG